MLTLILLNSDANRKPRTFHLDGERPEVLGRQSKTIQLPDSRISRRHAEVSVQNGVWVIRDLGSSNGTRVNGERITTLCQLEEGDRLEIGRLTLIVGHVEVDLAMHDAIAATELDLDGGDDNVAAADTLMQAPNTPEDDQGLPALQAAAGDDLDGASSPLLANAESEAAEDDPVAPPEENPLVAADLNTGEAADGVGENDDSSIAPSGELQADSPLSEAEIEHLDGAAFDELDHDEDLAELLARDDEEEEEEEEEEDIYAESSGAITPVVSRPESPIDPSVSAGSAEDDKLAPKVEPEVPAAASAEPKTGTDHPDDAVSSDGDAPEVVGLSLDMPAPEAEEEIVSAVDDPDAQETRVLDDEDELPLAAVPIDEDLDAALDDGMSDEFLASLDDEIEAAVEGETPVDVAAIAPEAATGAAFTYDSAVPEEPAGHGHELAEPEAMQDIAGSVGRGRGWRKAVAAALLLAAIGGGGWWAMQKTMAPDPIAGREADDGDAGADAPALTPEATAVASSSDATPPRQHNDPIDEPRAGTADTASTAPKPDAFGDAPTLGALETEPTAVAEIPPADPPAAVDQPAAAANDTEEATAESATPDIDDSAAAGPGLAMLEPRPQEPWEPITRSTIDLTETGDPSDNPGNPVVANAEPSATDNPPVATPAPAPARRIAYLIDASGSMVDSMNQGVLTWLEGEIQSLNEADEFTVVFFRSNDVFEVPPAGLRRAEDAARQDAIAWMSPQAGNIQPRGKSDPVDALRLARVYEATEIFILSDDKFGDRGTSLASVDVRDVAGFWVGQDVTFHTVQFYYEKDDDQRLQAIARRFGGKYQFVEEPPFDHTPGVDLFGVSQ